MFDFQYQYSIGLQVHNQQKNGHVWVNKLVKANLWRYKSLLYNIWKCNKYQPSGAGGTRSPPATPYRLPEGPKMADGVWKGVQS